MHGVTSTKLNSFLIKCLLLLCIVIFTCITWFSILCIRETFSTRLLVIAPTIFLIALLTFLIGYAVNRYMSKRFFMIFLITLAFSVRLIWILNIQTPVESDFKVMYQSAVQAINGDFSFANSPYYTTWVYQLGFTMYQALIMAIFGEGTFILKLLNVLYCTGTTLLIYKITSKIFNEWAARISGVIYALYIPSIMMSSVLTNQHLATFLFYLAFYLLVTKGFTDKYTWICIGTLLALGDIIRPLGMFILIAVAIYTFLHSILGQKKQTIFNSIKKLVGVFLVFYLVHYIISTAFISAGITQYPLSNRDPLWKFVLGFNHETNGGYSDEDASYVSQFEVGEERKKAEIELIKDRLADKEAVLNLFLEKFKLMWADVDSAPLWSLSGIGHDDLKDTATKYEKYIYTATMLFAIVSLLYLLFTKQQNNHYTLFLLLVVGYVCVHLLIEYQTRYRYFIIPSFVIIQGYGIYVCYHYATKMKLIKPKA